MIGKKLSPILSEIGDTILEFEVNSGAKPNFTDEGFRSGIKIFMSVLMDKMWELQENENMDMKDRINMSNKVGEDIRKLVKTYTNIDTHKLY
ncbi:hypothetical protein COB55_03885 [Candidatus Wolfebacteria bacterium]|nr:MAG: hypothetical protein COB55_03885 [Candidatus Wolfebacteria bacterium]